MSISSRATREVLSALASNDAGIALYTRAGFTRVGVYHEQGLLDGK
ncbi:MAG: hypothetical protein HY048_00255 [Acidobacteria bacterium]|nr:hypothetical protein [Acidobacteriota bacterium]